MHTKKEMNAVSINNIHFSAYIRKDVGYICTCKISSKEVKALKGSCLPPANKAFHHRAAAAAAADTAEIGFRILHRCNLPENSTRGFRKKQSYNSLDTLRPLPHHRHLLHSASPLTCFALTDSIYLCLYVILEE